MRVAVVGAKGQVGRICIDELKSRHTEPYALHKNDAIPTDADALIIAAPTEHCPFDGLLVDCSGSQQNTALSLPPIHTTNQLRKRTPNCMASLIAKALAAVHEQSTVTSILGTTMQSVSGAGWRGVQALKQADTQELFGGDLVNNVLPHEQCIREEDAIKKDLHALFGCEVTLTSFRVPVYVGHIASLHIETIDPINPAHVPESTPFDPRSMERKREIALGRVRINKNTADLVICGDQLLCGTAIPAVDSILVT
ncbi:MAG: Asd/ArgC dimerization domain-containing protein [Phycisphaerales bacterium]|jgi:aspartate-semialdehyde dehydrogenase|nr:Asd/ArgC dimerization domain-containing protein [Phycisphaerales bacterium]